MRKAYLSPPITATMAFLLCADAAVCWQHPCWFRGRIESVLMALWPPPPLLPLLNSPLESPFACTAALLRNLCVVPQAAAAAPESLILSPSHHRKPHLVFLCVLIDWGCSDWGDIRERLASMSVLSLPRQTSSALTLFRAPVWPPRWIIALRPSESLGRVSGGRH